MANLTLLGRRPSNNNRKKTKGRTCHTSRSRGYVPNRIIWLNKMLRDEKRALEIFNSKSSNYQIEHAEKKLHMQNRIKELEYKLGIQ